MRRAAAALLALLIAAVPASATEVRNITSGTSCPAIATPGEIGINRNAGLLCYNNATNTGVVPAALPSNAAAITYTPTLSANSGAFTTASATGRYLTIGRLVYVQMVITITTNGTASGFIAASLPFAPATNAAVIGIETTATGAPVMGQILSSTGLLYLKRMDGTTTGLFNGNVTATLSGTYERQ